MLATELRPQAHVVQINTISASFTIISLPTTQARLSWTLCSPYKLLADIDLKKKEFDNTQEKQGSNKVEIGHVATFKKEIHQ